MPVSLDRADLAVLATWPELQERARFPLPSTGLADGGRLQRFGVVWQAQLSRAAAGA